MAKLDRLGWASGISFTAYGRSFGVRLNTSEVPEAVTAALPPGWAPRSSPEVDFLLSLRLAGDSRPGVREFNLLYVGPRLAARSHDRALVTGLMEQEIQGLLAAHAPDRVFVHAGVVGWRSLAVVLPGRSMAGKSTLVAALLRAGATYYSDEFAVLDEEGRVHPYARRLALRTPGGADRQTAAALGAATGRDPLPVGLVVRADYRPGRTGGRPGCLRPGPSWNSPTTPCPRSRTRQPGSACSAAWRILCPRTGARGEAGPTAAAILNYLDARP